MIGRQQPPGYSLCRAVVMIVLGVGICNRTHENPRYRHVFLAGDVINLAVVKNAMPEISSGIA
jgi:hypothetical protein